MHATPIPHLTGLCFSGRISKQQSFKCLTVKGKQWPKIAHAPKGRRGCHGEQSKRQTDEKSVYSSKTCGKYHKNAVYSQCFCKFYAGDRKGSQQGDGSIK